MPNYKFYKTPTECKLEELVRGVAPSFRLLHLYSLIVKPFDQRFNFKLEITIQGVKDTHTFLLSDLYPNPKLEPTLFFVDGEKKYKAIVLPAGYKDVTFKIVLLHDVKEFEINLACDYTISVSKSKF